MNAESLRDHAPLDMIVREAQIVVSRTLAALNV